MFIPTLLLKVTTVLLLIVYLFEEILNTFYDRILSILKMIQLLYLIKYDILYFH